MYKSCLFIIGRILFTGELDVARQRLVPLAMTLFTKMVNAQLPFNLTLINVAFAKLEEVANNNIARFFSSCTAGLSTKDKDSFLLPQNSDAENGCLEDRFANMSAHDSSSGAIRTSSADLSDRDTVKNMPGKSANSRNVPDTVTCAHLPTLPRESTVSSSKRKHSNSLRNYFIKKHKLDSGVAVHTGHCEESLNQALTDCAKHEESVKSNEKVSLPTDIDPEVFAQLPQEIQKEIIYSAGQMTRACSKMLDSTSSSFTLSEHRSRTPQLSKIQSSIRVSFVKQNSISSISTVCENKPTLEMYHCEQKHCLLSRPPKKECYKLDDQSRFSPQKRIPEFICKNKQTRDQTDIGMQKETSTSNDLHSCKTNSDSAFSASTTPSLNVQKIPTPKGIDAKVFSALPLEIQHEIAAEMAETRPTLAERPKCSLPSKSPSMKVNSVLNYFKKTTS